MNKVSLEIALKFTEIFQKEYPKKDLHEITEALADEIEQAIQVQAKVKPDACGRCKECKHWRIEENEEWEYDELTFGKDEKYETLSRKKSKEMYGYEVGFCHNRKIKFYERPTVDGACVVDGSEYKARLITAENFGCVLFENKQ